MVSGCNNNNKKGKLVLVVIVIVLLVGGAILAVQHFFLKHYISEASKLIHQGTKKRYNRVKVGGINKEL